SASFTLPPSPVCLSPSPPEHAKPFLDSVCPPSVKMLVGRRERRSEQPRRSVARAAVPTPPGIAPSPLVGTRPRPGACVLRWTEASSVHRTRPSPLVGTRPVPGASPSRPPVRRSRRVGIRVLRPPLSCPAPCPSTRVRRTRRRRGPRGAVRYHARRQAEGRSDARGRGPVRSPRWPHVSPRRGFGTPDAHGHGLPVALRNRCR